MGDTVTLRVAGINNLNNPAGSGGDEFRATINGAESDKIWYQVDRAVAYEAIFGEDVRAAYLGSQERSQLAEMGVVFKTRDEVAGAGMGHYILWLKE
jgi:hypothetical protein